LQELEEGRNVRSSKKVTAWPTRLPVELELDEEEMLPSQPKILHKNNFFDMKLANMSIGAQPNENEEIRLGTKLRMSLLSIGPFKLGKNMIPVFLYTPALIPVDAPRQTNEILLNKSDPLHSIIAPLQIYQSTSEANNKKTTTQAQTLEELFPGTPLPACTVPPDELTCNPLEARRKLLKQRITQSQGNTYSPPSHLNSATSPVYPPPPKNSNITLPDILEDLARNLTRLPNSSYSSVNRNIDIDKYLHSIREV
jgi:hypothetical protein